MRAIMNIHLFRDSKIEAHAVEENNTYWVTMNEEASSVTIFTNSQAQSEMLVAVLERIASHGHG